MKFLDAVQAVQEIMDDSRLEDQGLAFHQALDFINRTAVGDTSAHPLLVVEAYAIATAIARGPEDSPDFDPSF